MEHDGGAASGTHTLQLDKATDRNAESRLLGIGKPDNEIMDYNYLQTSYATAGFSSSCERIQVTRLPVLHPSCRGSFRGIQRARLPGAPAPLHATLTWILHASTVDVLYFNRGSESEEWSGNTGQLGKLVRIEPMRLLAKVGSTKAVDGAEKETGWRRRGTLSSIGMDWGLLRSRMRRRGGLDQRRAGELARDHSGGTEGVGAAYGVLGRDGVGKWKG
ncbi:hypothetical protein BKA81DRAFT_421693 [Phyllosticta paracitricarpa]